MKKTHLTAFVISTIILLLLLTSCGSKKPVTIIFEPNINMVLDYGLTDEDYDVCNIAGYPKVQVGGNEDIMFMLCAPDGYYVIKNDDFGNNFGTVVIEKTDSSGYPVSEYPTDIFAADLEDADSNSEGEVALAVADKVYFFSNGTEEMGSYADGSMMITSVAGTDDGRFIVTEIDYSGSSETYVVTLDDRGHKDDTYIIKDLFDNLSVRVFGYGKGFTSNAAVNVDNIVYELDLPNASARQMISIKETFINPDYDRFIRSGDAYYIGGSRGNIFDGGSVDSGVYYIRPQYIESGRETVRIAFYNNSNEWFDKVITLFNVSNPSYYVEVSNYSTDNVQEFISDLSSDEGIDAVIYKNDQAGSLLSSGIFCDIDEVLDVDTSDLWPNVWNAELDENGQRMFIAPFVYVRGMYSADRSLTPYSSFDDIDEMSSYLDSSSAESFVMYDTKSYLFYQMLPMVIAKAQSEDDYLLITDLLCFCDEYGKDQGYTYSESITGRMTSGQLAFVNPDIGSFLQYILLNDCYDQPLIPTGCMCTEGLTFASDFFISVTDGRDDYSGINEFIDFMLLEDNLISESVYRLSYLPLSMTAAQTNIDWFVSFYDNGQITPTEITFSSPEGGSGGIMLPLMINDIDERLIEATDPTSYIDDYYDLINNTHGFLIYDDELFNLVIEETNSYFTGERDLDSVVQALDGRLVNYAAEH